MCSPLLGMHINLDCCYNNLKFSSGSHIVGSIPLQALIKAADYYIEKENVFLMKEQQKLRFVIDRLGLNSVSEFKPESKVCSYYVIVKNGFFRFPLFRFWDQISSPSWKLNNQNITNQMYLLYISISKLILLFLQVIEYVLGVNRHGPLQSSTVQQFVESVGSRTSTPGGGSVSALVTALGLALG